jgi:hypothetical protein
MKFKLHDIRESKVWQQAHEEGDNERLKKTIGTLVRKGKTIEEIGDLLDMPLKKIRVLANNHSPSTK